MEEQLTETTDVSNHRTRNIAILTGVSIGLIIAIAAIILLDPFGLNLLGRRMEIPARAMPPEVVLYAGMDLRNLQDEDLDPIVWAFSEELKQDQVSTIDRMNEELDKLLEDALGMSFTEDVMPWLGGAIGFALTEFKMDMWGGFEEVAFILAFEVRDKEAADNFLVKIEDVIAEQSGEAFQEETYQDVTLHILDTPYEYEWIVFCRSDDLILFSNKESTIKGAIDAQRGESLADDEGFLDVIGGLPSDRVFSLYLNGAKYLEMFSEIFSWMYGFDLMDLYGESADRTSDMAMGLSIADVGIRMDMTYKFDPETMSEEILESFVKAESRTAQALPEETLLHIYSYRLDLAWQGIVDALSAMEGVADFEESMEMFEQTFGFDLEDDLFARLDGEWAFAMMPSSVGLLSEYLELPLGFALLSETSDPQGLLEVSDAFSTNAELQGLGEVEKSQDEQGSYYDLVDMFSGTGIFTYGVGGDLFVIGSSKDVLVDIFTDQPSLAESDRYQQIWRSFARDIVPVMYLDIQGFVANIRETMTPEEREDFDEEVGDSLKPFTFLATGTFPPRKDLMQTTMILFIETE